MTATSARIRQRRTTWLVSGGVVVALIFALATGVATRPAPAARPAVAATDDHGYPRTYHIFGREGPDASLGRYDMVVGYAYWNVRALRARNPNGIFLLNPGLQPRDARNYKGLSVTYGGLSQWRGGIDRLAGGRKLGYIRAFNPYWDQLHNADGSVAEVNGVEKHPGWNLADPTARGTATLVAKVFAHASKLDGLYTKGWDGVHSDNWLYRIGVDWFYGSRLDSDRDGRIDDYNTLRRKWAIGLTSTGLLLRAYLPGKIVGGNGNWNVRPGPGGIDFRPCLSSPDAYLRSANYTLLEELQLYAGQADDIVDSIQKWLGYDDPRRQARYFATLQRLPGAGDLRSMRWGLSLATIAGAYYEAFTFSHDDRLWYDEYDGGVGIRSRDWLWQALTGPIKLSSGVWRRDFEHGVVLNNSTSSPQRVELGTGYRRLRGTQDPTVNTGATVTSVDLGPGDGLFLVRI
jgi:hypothetical protein